MRSEWSELEVPLARMLACAALMPTLRTILLFDASPADLARSATMLKAMLQVLMPQRRIQRVILRSTHSEEDLWGRYAPRSDKTGTGVEWKPGLLGPTGDSEIQLVVVEDLANSGLAVQRAAVTLAGASVGHLERDGESKVWQPSFYWLAACRIEELARVSPHLLDRFALRGHVSSALTRGSLGDLRAALKLEGEDSAADNERESPLLCIETMEALSAAAHCHPEFAPGCGNHVISYFPVPDEPSMGVRRELSLARTSIAEAKLDLSTIVTVAHVDRAAALLGIRRLGPSLAALLEDSEYGATGDLSTEAPLSTSSGTESPISTSEMSKTSAELGTSTVVIPASAEGVIGLPALIRDDPFKEDAQPNLDTGTLRLPFGRAKRTSRTRGHIIGTKSAHR